MCNGVAEIQGENGRVRESIIITTIGHKVSDWMIMLTTCTIIQVKEVVLKNGDVLPADIVIVGIGMCKNNSHFHDYHRKNAMQMYCTITPFFF